MSTIRPKKKWGQNFLSDKNIARKIVSSLEVKPPRLVIEIGPGQGILTEQLLKTGDPFIGIEIDPGLAGMLRNRFGSHANFNLIEADFLQISLPALLRRYPGHHAAVIGNIPYNITSPILFKLLDQADWLDQAVLMMQKEVGQRLVGQLATKDYGLLAIHSQLFAAVNYLFSVPARLFYPSPQVDSAVIRLTFKKIVRKQFSDFQFFNQVLRHCFQHRRKMLRKSLSMLFSPTLLTKLNADLTRRPEQLSIQEWRDLTESIYFHLHEEMES